jgi:hypothetical protein
MNPDPLPLNRRELQLRRAAMLGRSHGIAAGATSARRTVQGVATFLGAAGSLGALAVGVGILSVAGSLLLAAVGTVLMLLCAGAYVLARLLGASPLDLSLLALPLLLALAMIRRAYRNRLHLSGKRLLPR